MVFYVGSINCTKHHMRSKQDVFGRHFWEVAACILSEADGYNFGGILFYCTLAVETRTHVVNASDVFILFMPSISLVLVLIRQTARTLRHAKHCIL